MESVNAIFDGKTIKFLEPIPVQGQYEVKVIFEKPIDQKAQKRAELLSLSGSCSHEIVDILDEMELDRKNFFSGRNEDGVS